MIRAAPTVLGVKATVFTAVLIVVWLAAPYTNLFFLLITFLILCGLLDVVWTFTNLRGLTGSLREIRPVPAGNRPQLRSDLACGKKTRFQLAIAVRLDGRRVQRTRSTPIARGSAVIEGSLPPLPRGIHAISELFLESSYPLGLISYRLPLPGPSEIVVYPAPQDLPEAATFGEIVAEICGVAAATDGNLQPSGLREFVAGDELRQVHWRASARRGSLVVKEWEGSLATGIELVLDRRTDEETLEDSLSRIATLALAAAENKEQITVHSQGFTGTFGKTHQPMDALFRWLAGATVLPRDAMPPPATSPAILHLPMQPAQQAGGHR